MGKRVSQAKEPKTKADKMNSKINKKKKENN
jgi:hypothetical protein